MGPIANQKSPSASRRTRALRLCRPTSHRPTSHRPRRLVRIVPDAERLLPLLRPLRRGQPPLGTRRGGRDRAADAVEEVVVGVYAHERHLLRSLLRRDSSDERWGVARGSRPERALALLLVLPRLGLRGDRALLALLPLQAAIVKVGVLKVRGVLDELLRGFRERRLERAPLGDLIVLRLANRPDVPVASLGQPPERVHEPLVRRDGANVARRSIGVHVQTVLVLAIAKLLRPLLHEVLHPVHAPALPGVDPRADREGLLGDLRLESLLGVPLRGELLLVVQSGVKRVSLLLRQLRRAFLGHLRRVVLVLAPPPEREGQERGYGHRLLGGSQLGGSMRRGFSPRRRKRARGSIGPRDVRPAAAARRPASAAARGG
mmetsp:Transcript_4694/g.21364  ORF Transcript_4694/g.21364 Transcript_4694/m.21364 type:complete len:375 (-) Transcript_4694:372-1496(-)